MRVSVRRGEVTQAMKMGVSVTRGKWRAGKWRAGNYHRTAAIIGAIIVSDNVYRDLFNFFL